MAGVVHVPWYATLFRGDRFAEALAEIAAVSLRYGATDYRIYRSRDDAYKFWHFTAMESHAEWERFWYGPEFAGFRADYSSWYQVPILYNWTDLVAVGGLGAALAENEALGG